MIRARPPRSTAVALLQTQGLPVSDITDEHLGHFFYIGSDSSPAGLVGVEIYGAAAIPGSSRDCQNPRRRVGFAGLCPASSAFMIKRLQPNR
jgi:hypothetical protein